MPKNEMKKILPIIKFTIKKQNDKTLEKRN